MLRRLLIALAVPVLLAACGADNRWDPESEVRAARYSSAEPPSISLLTVVGIPRGEGGHSALLINASQQVILDPAGSFTHPRVPERHDVLYGITPNLRNVYLDYHAREMPGENYYVIEDKIRVSPEIAEMALRSAEMQGPTNKSFCTVATAAALRRVPGFESAPNSFSPIKLRQWFLRQPGVETREYRHGDPAMQHTDVLRMKDGSYRAYEGGVVQARQGQNR